MTERKNPNATSVPYKDDHDSKQDQKLNAHEASIRKIEKLAQKGQQK